MRLIVKSIVWQAPVILAIAAGAVQARSSMINQILCAPPNISSEDMQGLVLNFELDESKFQVFMDIAQYRRSSGLAPLPGFPENPNLNEAVAELGRDVGTMERLGRSNLGPRDYILTAWALIIARDPADWGLEENALSPRMRHNIVFVRLHRASLDALLRS